MSRHPWEKLAAGEQWRGWWETGLAGAPALPVLAARGAHPGPTLLVTGAVHGDEYEGTTAIHALFRDLDLSALHGMVIGLPVVNGAAWAARARVAPTDQVDLNRVFPGPVTPTQEPTRLLAEKVFATFVQRCDLLVDLHSGGLRLVHLPMVGWYAGGREAERLARGFGAALHPWLIPNVAGVLSYEAHRVGKVALGAEWGGGGRLDPAGAAGYAAGLRRILAVMAGAPVANAELDPRSPVAGRYQEVVEGGLFIPQVVLGDRIEADSPLGTLYNTLGEQVAVVKAFRNGLLAALAHLAWIEPGGRVAYIG
jgi:predicted deacylase